MDFVEDILAGKWRAISRLITLVERHDPAAPDVLRQLYGHCGRAHIIGITGPPGAGKSCLIAALIRQFRMKNLSVGVLAVDPSSPFTGGAILGDRARMAAFSNDPEVFIRSIATRGASGGLSEAVNSAADILDAAGKDIILIETVGVGQNEIDIVRLAHTVILVLAPGFGDALQAMKAGILEIADILVVNKADQPGADAAVTELYGIPAVIAAERVLGAESPIVDGWRVPVTKTSTVQDTGSADLVRLTTFHFKFLADSDRLSIKNRGRRVHQFLDILLKRIRTEFLLQCETDPGLKRWIGKIGELEIDPYQASSQVMDFIVRARENARSVRHSQNAAKKS